MCVSWRQIDRSRERLRKRKKKRERIVEREKHKDKRNLKKVVQFVSLGCNSIREVLK